MGELRIFFNTSKREEIGKKMEEEMKSLMKVSIWVTSSLTYSYFLSSRIPPGKARLISLLPVLYLLLHLPFFFSSIHLRGISSFFLSWLAVFKLLLFSFGHGPLSSSLPLPTFISTASLPIKLKPPKHGSQPQPPRTSLLLSSAVKFILLAFIIPLYTHNHSLNFYLLQALHSIHLYLILELILASASSFSRALLGVELEPQFNAPYLASSLQDFWGCRWNLMASAILRPTVYAPVRARWGPLPAFMATFLVSGLMHELMFYYVTLTPPTGEVFCFFALHGLCVVAEVSAKRVIAGRWRLHPVVSVPLTVGFVLVTGFWLFFPPIRRGRLDERAKEECRAVIGFFLDTWRVVVRGMVSV